MTENKTQIVVGCFYDYCGICCCKNECYMYKTLDNIKTNVDYQIEGRELEIKELKAQIEKMKCCENCDNNEKDDWYNDNFVNKDCEGCENHCNWKLKE